MGHRKIAHNSTISDHLKTLWGTHIESSVYAFKNSITYVTSETRIQGQSQNVKNLLIKIGVLPSQ